MQNLIQKFRQRAIVFKKPGILPKNLKTLTSSNYPTVHYFLPLFFAHSPHASVEERRVL